MAQLTHFPDASASSPRPTSWISNSLWGLMRLLSAGVAVYASTYFFYTPGDAHFSRYIQLLRLHIAGGMGALLLGPWQFSQRLRTRALNRHRWMGRFYLLSVAVGSIGGFGMAVVSEGGLPTHLGFGILAVLWFVTGLHAYRIGRHGNVAAHLQGVIRQFSLNLESRTPRPLLTIELFLFRLSFV